MTGDPKEQSRRKESLLSAGHMERRLRRTLPESAAGDSSRRQGTDRAVLFSCDCPVLLIMEQESRANQAQQEHDAELTADLPALDTGKGTVCSVILCRSSLRMVSNGSRRTQNRQERESMSCC